MAKAKIPGKRPQGAKPQVATAGQTVTVEAAEPKKRTSIPQFFSQVRAEARKIVWPSRKETWITSVMVFIMVAIATLFFWIVDFVLAWASGQVLSIG
ncbi:preprotein translocase subunit SecE [Brevundimonas sp. VNH65]|uniref:preprotein translocase subunit SecE n=1 Tax=Brevundimonas sp. VNH65 TaxID=3400917 RepID=UPI003C0BD6D7